MPTFEERRNARRAEWRALKDTLRKLSLDELKKYRVTAELTSHFFANSEKKRKWLDRRIVQLDAANRRKRLAGYRVSSGGRSPYLRPMSRFRSRVTLLGRSPSQQSSIGVIRKYNTAGKLIETTNVHLTGSPASKDIRLTWDNTNKKKRVGSRVIYESGGPFVSVHTRCGSLESQGFGIHSTRGNPGFSGNARWEYEGGFYNPVFQEPSSVSLRYADAGGSVLGVNSLVPSVTEFAPQAYKSLRPQLSKGNLFQFLVEIREAPRMIMQSARAFSDIWKGMGGHTHTAFMSPKRVADEFLNTQFGWVPFVSDVGKLSDAFIFSKQYEADITAANNTWIKRRAVLKNEKATTRLGVRSYSPGCEPVAAEVLCKQMVVDGITCPGYFDTFQDTQSMVWSEGSFKYYRPEFDKSLISYDSSWSKAERLATIYGLRVNPSTLYKVTPWTWLIDWFTQTGDLIDQVTEWGLDGVVSRYMYLMRSDTKSIRSSHFWNFWSSPLVVEWTRFLESKQRVKADNPYGFFLTSKDLTARQLTILAALGASRKFELTRYF